MIKAGGDVGGDPALRAKLDEVNRASEEVNRIVARATADALDDGSLVGSRRRRPRGAVRRDRGPRGAASGPRASSTSTHTATCAPPTRASPGRMRRSCATSTTGSPASRASSRSRSATRARRKWTSSTRRSGRLVLHSDRDLARAALEGKSFAATAQAHRRGAPPRGLRVVRHRRARAGLLPTHRDSGPRRALVPRGGVPPRHARPDRAPDRRVRSLRGRARDPTATSGTRTSGARILYKLIGFALKSRLPKASARETRRGAELRFRAPTKRSRRRRVRNARRLHPAPVHQFRYGIMLSDSGRHELQAGTGWIGADPSRRTRRSKGRRLEPSSRSCSP